MLITLIVAFAIAIAITVPIVKARAARREPTEPEAPAPNGNDLAEVITRFGEELDRLPFAPHDPDVTAAMLRDYEQALEAYEDAKALQGDHEAAMRAVHSGRAALIRLAARREGRPVPLDAHHFGTPEKSAELTATADRFCHAGKETEHDRQTKHEVLVPWPERDRPALVDFQVNGFGNFHASPMIRTESAFKTHEAFSVPTFDRSYRGRFLIQPEVTTHIKVEIATFGEPLEWSARFHPITAAETLRPEHHGNSEDVLWHPGGYTEVAVQIKTDGYWHFRYICTCRMDDCRCGDVYVPNKAYGTGDGMERLVLPRPGWIDMQFWEPATWSIQPVGPRC